MKLFTAKLFALFPVLALAIPHTQTIPITRSTTSNITILSPPHSLSFDALSPASTPLSWGFAVYGELGCTGTTLIEDGTGNSRCFQLSNAMSADASATPVGCGLWFAADSQCKDVEFAIQGAGCAAVANPAGPIINSFFISCD